MASLIESAKKVFTPIAPTDKVADLQRDIQDLDTPDRNRPNDLTTDHGVKVSDTDNWCATFKLASMCWLVTCCDQAQSDRHWSRQTQRAHVARGSNWPRENSSL